MRQSAISLIAILTFVAASATADDFWGQLLHSESGSGNIETETRELESFSEINVAGGLDVYVKIDAVQSVEVTFHDNLLARIKTDVQGNTLRIYSKGSFSTRRPCRIDITVPSLNRVTVSGSGDVDIVGLKGDALEYRVSGSGDLKAEGEVGNLIVHISGSGDVDTRRLVADNVEVSVSGSGDARVFAKESFDGTVSGSGEISFYGNPEDVSRHVSGSGDIRKKR